MTNDRRFIGSGVKDETIGRLMERTEALMDQNKSFERTLDTFNGTMETFGRTVMELKGSVQQLSKSIDRQEEIDDRCDKHEKRLDAIDTMTVNLPIVVAEVLFWRRVLGGGFHALWKLAAFAVSTGGIGGLAVHWLGTAH